MLSYGQLLFRFIFDIFSEATYECHVLQLEDPYKALGDCVHSEGTSNEIEQIDESDPGDCDNIPESCKKSDYRSVVECREEVRRDVGKEDIEEEVKTCPDVPKKEKITMEDTEKANCLFDMGDTENQKDYKIEPIDVSALGDSNYIPESCKELDQSSVMECREEVPRDIRKKIKRKKSKLAQNVSKKRKMTIEVAEKANCVFDMEDVENWKDNEIEQIDVSDSADSDYVPDSPEVSDSCSFVESEEEVNAREKFINCKKSKFAKNVPKKRKVIVEEKEGENSLSDVGDTGILCRAKKMSVSSLYPFQNIVQSKREVENHKYQEIEQTNVNDPEDSDYLQELSFVSNNSSAVESEEEVARDARKKLKRVQHVLERRSVKEKDENLSDMGDESSAEESDSEVSCLSSDAEGIERDGDISGSSVTSCKCSRSFTRERIYRKQTDKKHTICDKKNKDIYVRKVLKSEFSLTGIKKKRMTVWNQVHCCKFCKKILSNISKHFKKHDNKHQVKEIVELTKKLGSKNATVKAMWDVLRNDGDSLNNKKVLKKGHGEMILGRRQFKGSLDVDQYGPCPGCHVWIKLNKTLHHHQKVCPAAILGQTEYQEMNGKELRILSMLDSGRIQSEASKALRLEVFSIMKNDEISNMAQKDILIISLGNLWLLKNIGNQLKRKYYTSQRMRDAARLLINLQQQTHSKLTLYDYLTPALFESVVKATLTTASPDFDDDEDLKAPSTAIKLGNDIKRMVGAKWAMSLKSYKQEEVSKCNDFLKLMQLEWSVKVTKMALITLQLRQFSREKSLPHPDDLVNLQNHVKAEVNKLELGQAKASLTTFRRAVELCQTRLLIYNKRRSGEIEAIS